MIGKCNKCGYQAGIVNLKNGVCKSCLNNIETVDINSSKNISRIEPTPESNKFANYSARTFETINKHTQKRKFIFRFFVIFLTVIYVAILLLIFIIGSAIEGAQLSVALGIGLTSPFITSIIALILSPNGLVAKILRIYAMTTIIIFIMVNLSVFIVPSPPGYYSWPYIVFIFFIPWVIVLALHRHTAKKWQA